ncbi:MAG: outer membrane beta-barrel protein [Gemmatimonadales bacterium]
MKALSLFTRSLVATAAVGALALPARAQSAQPWSLQASVLADNQKIGSSAISGVGFEAMVRYTPSAWSVGLGYEYATHSSNGQTLDISGAFLEPRYAIDIGSDRVAPYLAGRVAFLNESSKLRAPTNLIDFSSGGTAFGAGAGILIRASKTVNIDLGAAIVQQSFQDASRNGVTVSFTSFAGYIAKAGISIGFGGK